MNEETEKILADAIEETRLELIKAMNKLPYSSHAISATELGKFVKLDDVLEVLNTKPLEVIFLCYSCHAEADALLEKLS